ncbi:hypothetical protein [Aureimonas mangrovi]|uniref:hypothetical protein n=1 Tax=Aureimonas mangrovi TaxID=2758041 RepID=UPI001FEBF64D|nr:hypothetical protein [Aureimonas mangrovi]
MLEPTDRTLADPSGRTRDFELACASCGLVIEGDAFDREARALMRKLLEGGDWACFDRSPFGMDAYTARIAATAVSRRYVPHKDERHEMLRPHGAAAARGTSRPFVGQRPVTLGLICREDEIDAVLRALPPHAGWASDVVVLADGASRSSCATAVAGFAPGAVRIAHRPLAGDFAAQRNALQGLARSAWVMQLDADETLPDGAASLLPALARMGEEDGLLSIGLPRNNLVDGSRSDVFPDVQYRLNRREVRFAGPVHERPERSWQQSTISLHGAIDHHLSRAHVASRSQRYETLSPGNGRLEEVEALLRPYRD